MPSSLPVLIYPIIESITMMVPDTVLDIGIGWGKYGLLAREYLSEYGKPKKVDGIEIFEPYITPIQKAIYDNIFIGNVMEIEFGNYDLILLIDVIEHLKKEEGLTLLQKIADKSRYFVVSSPMGFTPQEPERGNKYEEHLSGWMPEEFSSFEDVRCWGNPTQFCFLFKGRRI